MSDEIVTRLREALRQPPDFDYGASCETVPVRVDYLREAAERIERLEKALEPFARAFDIAEAPAISHGEYVAMRNSVDIQDFRRAAQALSKDQQP
jgi:hypothetical protein